MVRQVAPAAVASWNCPLGGIDTHRPSAKYPSTPTVKSAGCTVETGWEVTWPSASTRPDCSARRNLDSPPRPATQPHNGWRADSGLLRRLRLAASSTSSPPIWQPLATRLPGKWTW